MKKPLLLLIPALFLIASCGETPKPDPKPDPEPTPEHQHTFSNEWSKDSAQHWHAATCEHTDLKSDIAAHIDNDNDYICDICGYELPLPPPIEHTHTFASEWTTSSTEHWHVATCGHDVVDGLAKHVDDDEDNICDVCLMDLTAPEPKKPCPEGQCVDSNQDGFCDVCGFPYEYKHAKTVKGDPNAPFFLKVGEEKLIKAVLDPVPERDIEKTFKWKTSNSSIATITPDAKDSRNATVKALKSGEVIITAANDYSSALKYEFHINCIDFNADDMVLWEYSNNDKSQFGYTSDNKAGVQSGTANLGGLEWDFTRSEVVSLNTSKTGMIGFGKGSDPETRVELVNNNKRKVQRIEIETVSANALANVTIKVGDTEVINCKTPSSTEDIPPAINSGTLEDLTGDISILFETPEYDAKEAAEHPDTYKAPGAFYIKYIWITYAPTSYDFVTEKTYDFKEMYDDGVVFKDITQTAKPLKVVDDEDFSINLASAKAPKTDGSGVQGYALTNGIIDINLKKTSEVAKYVEFKYEMKNSNTYTIYSSKLGGEPFTKQVASGTSVVSGFVLDDNVNAIRLANSSNSYVGLISLTIKTIEGSHGIIKGISLKDGAKPDKVEYQEGDSFDPTGLGDIIVSFTDENIEDVLIPSTSLTFYDGPSYDEPADHSGKKTILFAGTTDVVGIYKDFELRVSDIVVTVEYKTMSRVKSDSDLTTGEYLFVIPNSAQYWKGSMKNSDMKTSNSIGKLEGIEINDTFEVSKFILDDMLTITNDSGLLTITNKSKGKIGMTKSGSISIAEKPEYSNWEASINDGIIDFSISGGDNTKFLVFNSKFNLGSEASSNIALYKVVD